jgi:hypothetical protein
MYHITGQKIVSDPVQPPPREAAATKLKPRTLTERQAVRLEMTNLNARILAGFQNRARYQQPRRDMAGF